MKSKFPVYTLIGAMAGMAAYLVIKSLKEVKRKAEIRQEEALKSRFRKKFSNEHGEYTL